MNRARNNQEPVHPILSMQSGQKKTHNQIISPGPQSRQRLELLIRKARKTIADRAQMVLLSADGATPHEIGEKIGKHQKTVRRWLRLFNERGVDGLYTFVKRKENTK